MRTTLVRSEVGYVLLLFLSIFNWIVGHKNLHHDDKINNTLYLSPIASLGMLSNKAIQKHYLILFWGIKNSNFISVYAKYILYNHLLPLPFLFKVLHVTWIH